MLAFLHPFFIFLTAFFAARAADPPFQIGVTDATLAAGASGKVAVSVVIPPEFHIYREMLEISVVDAGGLTVGAPVFPAGDVVPDPANPGQTREQYEQFVTIDVPVKAPTAAGSRYLTLKVRYQACKRELCYMPATEEVTAAVSVVARSGRWMGLPVAALLVPAAFAQDPSAEEIAVRFAPGTSRDDHVVVRVDLEGDWHLNKMFMSATLQDADGLSIGEPILPAAHPSGSQDDGSYREDFVSDFDLLVPVSGPAGARSVKVEVGYQACKGLTLCRMPTAEVVEVPLTLTGTALAAIVSPAAAAVAPPHAAEATAAPEATTAVAAVTPVAGGEVSEFEIARAQGLWALLALCFAAGLGVSFTPCVLPMVPITMGIIGARSAGSKVESLSRAATYVAGLAMVYTTLGVVAGVTGGMFGAWLQSAWVVGGISGLFLVMGAGMFGIFNIQLPASIAGRLQSGNRKGGGYADAFVVGMVGALVAGPCSGPVVVAILGLITKEGEVGLGAALMAVFSLGMGMIFLVTGAASGWLPSRGPWMDLVKKSFGIFLWLGAIYYARSLLPEPVLALSTAFVLLFTAVFAWPHADDGEGYALERARQLYTLVGGLVGAYLLVGTLWREGFILPPMQAVGATSATSAASVAAIPWLPDEASGLAAAKASGKPLMIDFTAEWCAACHEMEKYTYTDPKVIAAAEGFVPVMIDCTDKADPVIQAVLDKYDVRGLPKVVFVTADGRVLGSTQDYVPADQFLPKMESALAAAG